MHRKTREVLDIIEDVLLTSWEPDSDHVVATELWEILSALRGPDNGNINAKASTISVRNAAFPRIAKKLELSFKSSSNFSNYPLFYSSLKADEYKGGYHFAWHIDRAILSLNAKDESTNETS